MSRTPRELAAGTLAASSLPMAALTSLTLRTLAICITETIYLQAIEQENGTTQGSNLTAVNINVNREIIYNPDKTHSIHY